MSQPRYSLFLGRHRQRGAAFIVALLVVTMLLGVVLVFARGMNTSASASRNEVSQSQARWIALGAIEAIRGELAERIGSGEPPRLDAVGVQAVEMGNGLYWVIGRNITATREDSDTPKELTFGLVSEAGKLNLHQTSLNQLAILPGMTEALAAAIQTHQQQFQDSESTESQSALATTLETIDDLLLIDAVNAIALDGEDLNRNGVLDPNEDDGDASPPSDNADGRLDRGVRDFVTVYSRELLTSDAGEPRVPLNQGGQGLGPLLEANVTESRYAELVSIIPGNRPYRNILDFFVRGQLTPEEFATLHDKITTDDPEAEASPGRIDIYSSPPEVLDAIEGLGVGDGEKIVNTRPTLDATESPGDYAWLIDAIGEDKALSMPPILTHRSLQFSADVVAVTADGRGFCRLRYVLDAAAIIEGEDDLPTILYVQDLTSLGWPLDPLILTDLRQGTPITEIVSQHGPTGL